MDHKNFITNYNNKIYELVNSVPTDQIENIIEIIVNTSKNNGTVYIVGNGGSASIASHVSVDFTKTTNIISKTFNDSNLITCFANDFGYENWVKEAVKSYCNNNDTLILISSSGQSLNIINAARYCKESNISLVTLSGFKSDNPLSKIGNENIYINSNSYNFVEMSHHIILVSIVDIFAQKLNK